MLLVGGAAIDQQFFTRDAGAVPTLQTTRLKSDDGVLSLDPILAMGAHTL